MKKKAILLLGTMAAALVMVSGAALAETVLLCYDSPCYGTDQAETMVGTNNIFSTAFMYARGGDDTMYGKDGSDYMVGGPGEDDVSGGPGKDTLYGGANGGADTSGDNVYGGDGMDLIYGGYATAGVDHIYGGKGDDLIHADRAQTGSILNREVIDCGPGEEDSVYFDKGVDDTTNCEIKHPY